MELFLLGSILGVGACTAYDYFVIKPKLRRLTDELRGQDQPESIEDQIAKADAAIEASMERIRNIAATYATPPISDDLENQ